MPRVVAFGTKNARGFEFHCFKCESCGFYGLTQGAIFKLRAADQTSKTRAIVAHWIRRRSPVTLGTTPDADPPLLIESDVDQILNDNLLPNAAQVVDNFLLWFDALDLPLGHRKEIGLQFQETLVAQLGCESRDGVQFAIGAAKDIGLLAGSLSHFQFELSLKGWKRIQELKAGSTNSSVAFLACKFDSTVFTKPIEDHFKAACRETGFELRRLDDSPRTGNIDVQMRLDLRDARFVVVDLSDKNEGAYWEAGFAEGSLKPVIYLCKQSVWDDPNTKPHFDADHCYFVIWNDPPIEALEKFKATIRFTFPDSIR